MPPSPSILQALVGGASGLGNLASGMGLESIGGALSGLSGAMSAVAPVVGAVTQGLGMLTGAIQSAVTEFLSIPDKVRPFVEAFAPSTVLVFDQAIRDVSAVIGSALVPVLNASTEVVRAFGDAILPAMQRLGPVLQVVTDNFMRLLLPVIDSLGGFLSNSVEVLKGFVASLEELMPLLEGTMALWQAVNALAGGAFRVLGDVLSKAVVGPLLQLVGMEVGFENAGEALKSFSMGLIRVAAVLAKLAGAHAFLDGMRKAFGEGQQKDSTVGFAAAQNAKIETVPEWARQLAVNASMAAGAAGKSPEDAWRDEVKAMLDDISMKSMPDLLVTIRDGFGKFLNELEKLPGKIAAELTRNPLKQGSHVKNALEPKGRNAFDPRNSPTGLAARSFLRAFFGDQE